MSSPGSMAVDVARPWADRTAVAAELSRARDRTLAICDQLGEDDLLAQHSPLMSPMVWDLAHIGNYEELWLLRELDGRPAIDADLDDLYNAFEHPRWERPSLPILGPAEARAYDARVRAEVLALLERVDLTTPPSHQDDRARRLLCDAAVYGMVLQHEHQHCETLLATLQLMGDRAVAPPGTLAPPVPADRVVTTDQAAGDLVLVDGATVTVGAASHPWSYDNERPAHEVALAPFAIGRHPVTNRQWQAFMLDGGYDETRWWTSDGWAWRLQAELVAPQFWTLDGEGSTSVLRFGRHLDLADLLDEPVQHVCLHEAEAFCRWSGTRLPTEAEWEAAATWDPATRSSRSHPWGEEPADAGRANLGQRHAGPAPIGSYPDGISPSGVWGMLGDVWEWTATDFVPYPGFESFPYDEYSRVFFGSDHRVLRGGSWAADPLAVRGSFRNWDHPIRRQIFCGLRVASDV